MPAGLREVLRTYPARDHWASFTAAQAYAAAGFRVLPCQPGGKRPVISDRFRHGAKSATSDREAVRDAFIGNPGSNVGVAVDHHFVVVDVDVRNGGTLEAADRLGLPVDGIGNAAAAADSIFPWSCRPASLRRDRRSSRRESR